MSEKKLPNTPGRLFLLSDWLLCCKNGCILDFRELLSCVSRVSGERLNCFLSSAEASHTGPRLCLRVLLTHMVPLYVVLL